MLSNTLRLNFWHPKMIGILHPHYLTITGYILKNKQKNKHVCYSWDYAINHNENEDENEKKIYVNTA